LYESQRAVFYAPFYAAFSMGAFTDENLDVRLERPQRPELAARGVLDGLTDAAWGGPMRIMEHHNAHADCGIVGFCEVVMRDPFMLVGRMPKPDFRMRDLLKVRMGVVSEVPTPWMCLQDDIRRAGIDPDQISRISDRGMADNCAALRAGELDVVQCFQPHIEQLLREGAHIWYASADRGPTTYTCFYALRSTIDKNPETMRGLTRAMWRVQRWIADHSGAELAEQVAGFFPNMSHEILCAALESYKRLNIWASDPRMSIVGYVRLKCALLSGGFIRRDVSYEHVIDNTIISSLMLEGVPPPLRKTK
jgi:NitT/TauT family transport system substrate-binding protein